MTLRPLNDRVIVKRTGSETKTLGGIIIPDTAQEKPVEAEVIAVGTGKMLDNGMIQPMQVKVGDKVLFGKYSGTEVKIGGEEHLILREDDILAVVCQDTSDGEPLGEYSRQEKHGTIPEKKLFRITFRSEIYIKADSEEDARIEFCDIPLFTEEACEHAADFVEYVSIDEQKED